MGSVSDHLSSDAISGQLLAAQMWDARTGDALTTLHGHNEHVTSVRWNANGNWLLSASRDQSCKASFCRAVL